MTCKKTKYIVYVGDFDFTNSNVQSFYVENIGKIMQSLGYKMAFIGINTKRTATEIDTMPKIEKDDCIYFELPNTLNLQGLFRCSKVWDACVSILDKINQEGSVQYVVSYQAPTYSKILDVIVRWCRDHGSKYIVNCADLPIFAQQPFYRRIVMKANWNHMHRVNKKEADGIIAVSKYIAAFYAIENRESIIVPPLFDYSDSIAAVSERNDIVSFVYAGTPFKKNGRKINPAGMKDRLDIIIDLFIELSKKKTLYTFSVLGITEDEYLTAVPRHNGILPKEIEFLGLCSHDQTLKMISDADFSINYRDDNMMTRAGFSTKIVESVSVGTPVVINPIGDTFEYIEDGVSGFALKDENKKNIALLEELCKMTKSDRKRMKENLCSKRLFDINSYKDAIKSFLL